MTEIFGVGPIIAAMVIGYTGDVGPFPTAGHYAAYNGTAPIEFSSGRTHRAPALPTRQPHLNHAIHMIAVTQIRNPTAKAAPTTTASSPRARPTAEAMRALKRQISDRASTDNSSPTPANRSGRTIRERLFNPAWPALSPEPGTSDQSLPDPTTTLRPPARRLPNALPAPATNPS